MSIRRRLLLWLVMVLLMLLARLPAAAQTQELFHVTVDMKADLQALLDLHRQIRLDADRDYRSIGVASLKVASGERIEGGWNTRVPPLQIAAGSSQIFISGVRADAALGPDVVFAPGAETSDVEIVGGNGGIGTHIHVKVSAGARLRHLNLTEFGGLEVDQAQSGYVRDSVFARLVGYWPGPHIAWRGNRTEPSGGNSFFGLSSITPQKGAFWRQAGDLNLFNADCESWNMHDHDQPQCFLIQGSGRVVLVGLSGGTANRDRDGALAALEDDDALLSWFYHGQGGVRDGADLLLDNVAAAVWVQSAPEVRIADRNAQASDVRLHLIDPQGLSAAGVQQALSPLRASPPAHWAPLLRAPTEFAAEQKPQRRFLAEPAVAPLLERAAQPDAAPLLQAQIDRDGLVRLPAGIYYLDRPLKLGSRQRIEGLLGEDRERVVLVAKGDFPVIEGRGDFRALAGEEGVVVYLVLDGLTLYGGRAGIHWSNQPGNLGDHSTVAFSSFRNLKFMHQRVAGVLAEGIHGLDTNTWYRVDFFDMPVAVRGDGHGANGPMAYADKQSFVDCQFQQIRDAVWDWTADRASGGELWKDDYFVDVGAISTTRSANSLLWVNSVFENIAGPVALHITDVGATATYYFFQVDCLWRGRGPDVVTDTQSAGIGTLFIDTEFAQQGGTLVAAQGRQSLFSWGSRITGSAHVSANARGRTHGLDEGVLMGSYLAPAAQALEMIYSAQHDAFLGPVALPPPHGAP